MSEMQKVEAVISEHYVTLGILVNSIRVGEFFELTNGMQEDQKQGVWESLGLVGEYLINDLDGVFK